MQHFLSLVWQNSTAITFVVGVVVYFATVAYKRYRVRKGLEVIRMMEQAKRGNGQPRYYKESLWDLIRARKKHAKAMRDPLNRSVDRNRNAIAKIDWVAKIRGAFPRGAKR